MSQQNPARRRKRPTSPPDEHPAHLLPRRRPLQARARQRVERILEVTAELITRGEPEALTTAEIAEHAGVPIGSVYHYFPSKEAILAELVERKFVEVDTASAERLARDLERMAWPRALERALDAAVTAFRSDPVYMSLWQTARSSPDFRSVSRASDERLATVLEQLPPFQPLSPARARRVVRTAIRMTNMFLDWILETEDAREASGIVREMKHALVLYLEAEIDGAATRTRLPKAGAR